MIARMKKITLLVSEKERKHFIFKLRKAGVLHVKAFEKPASHDLVFSEDKIEKIEELISNLEPYEERGNLTAGKEGWEISIAEEDEAITELLAEKAQCLDKIDGLKMELQWFDTWGAFDPKDAALLKRKGVYVKFYRLFHREYGLFKKTGKHVLIKKDKKYVYVATLSMNGENILSREEEKIPSKAREGIKKEIDELFAKIRESDNFLRQKAGMLDVLRKRKREMKSEHVTIEVKNSMKEEGRFAYIQGYCPEKKLEDVIRLTKECGLGYLVEEPDSPDETPTLLENPMWIRIIDPIFRLMNTLPGYEEFDISFQFLVFFSIFFAMIVGDAGYGAVFLIITFLARRKLKNLPVEPFILMYLLSTATILWGAVTGVWFGVEEIAKMPFFNAVIIEKINSFSEGNQDFMIFICFIIGTVHLTIAHLLKGIKVVNSVKVISEAGWILVLWGMFFVAEKFVLGKNFPPFAGWMLISGVALALFCSNPQKGVFKGALATLAELPLSIISSFSDIVSYLRLFAVGYATVVLAGSFNQMAMSAGKNNILSGLMAAGILFLGHVLNIALSLMAVIVHGVRLNMLEFSGHLGMQWSGREYNPFREKEV